MSLALTFSAKILHGKRLPCSPTNALLNLETLFYRKTAAVPTNRTIPKSSGKPTTTDFAVLKASDRKQVLQFCRYFFDVVFENGVFGFAYLFFEPLQIAANAFNLRSGFPATLTYKTSIPLAKLRHFPRSGTNHSRLLVLRAGRLVAKRVSLPMAPLARAVESLTFDLQPRLILRVKK